jgi:hypothetical protein
MGFGERFKEAEARRLEREWRLDHDRVRVIVTGVNEPDPDDPADYLWLQIKATKRLQALMVRYADLSLVAFRDGFEIAPPNYLPQHGSQLRITEDALAAVTGYWGNDDWRGQEGVRKNWLTWAIDDFVHALSGYHALVQWAR